jgi:hypothetical protein
MQIANIGPRSETRRRRPAHFDETPVSFHGGPVDQGIDPRKLTPALREELFNGRPKPLGKSQGGIVSSAEIQEAAEPKSQGEPIRPEIKEQIDTIQNLPISGVKATTRGLVRTEMFIPEAPTSFNGQRYQFDFENGDQTVGLIVDTESGFGHCRNGVPGQDQIPGAEVSFLSNSNDSRSTQSSLNRNEVRYLIESLYGRYENAMSKLQADRGNTLISACFAVYGKEGGQADSIQMIHNKLASQLQRKPAEVDGWNLRGR